jgi:glycosyltransferase involved in cell wall biosynthesis
MPNNPVISVLMPAYNTERFILRNLQSLLAQTFEDFELLVVDDGSTDRTMELVTALPDRRIRYFRNQQNLGIVGSLNRGFALARGTFIARIDADDLCHPTRFERQLKLLTAEPEVVLCATEMSVLRQGRIGFT